MHAIPYHKTSEESQLINNLLKSALTSGVGVPAKYKRGSCDDEASSKRGTQTSFGSLANLQGPRAGVGGWV
jgi:hypothetical protein